MCTCMRTHLGCFGSHLSRLGELALTEQHVELAYKELLSSGQVVASGNAKSKVRVTKSVGDIGNEVGIIYTHRENLGVCVGGGGGGGDREGERRGREERERERERESGREQ